MEEMKYLKKLADRVNNKYNDLVKEGKHVCRHQNITRYTIPIMTRYVEDYIAVLVNDILDGERKNYEIQIDTQMGGIEKRGEEKKNPTIRPDIIVYERTKDNKCKIILVLEVKSQLGYAGDWNHDDYMDKIDRMYQSAKSEKLHCRNGKEHKEIKNFIFDANYKSGVVVLMASNCTARNNAFSNFMKNENYFCFFDATIDGNKKNVNWYHSISLSNIYKEKGKDFEAFVKFLKD